MYIIKTQQCQPAIFLKMIIDLEGEFLTRGNQRRASFSIIFVQMLVNLQRCQYNIKKLSHNQVEFTPVMQSWFNIQTISGIYHISRLKK